MSMMADNDAGVAVAGAADEQLKKRARRRLVGAIALVLLAVIVLPMVMDHEPRPTGPEIQVRIPSQEGTAVRPAAKPAKPVAEIAKAPDNGAAPSAPIPAAPVESKAAPVVPPPEARPELKGEVKGDKPDAKPVAKPDPKTDGGAGVKQDAAADAERANAALAGRGEQWVVQLGAYQEAGRVKILLDKIKQLGLPAFTEKVDTPQGPRTRVRAGPFPNREAALKAQERVKIIGVSGPVAPK